MVARKLAAVLGATRGQGASVVDALLKTGRYNIRGVTEVPQTPDADRLRHKGVEVVGVDLDDPGSLKSAFDSVRAIFAVTTMYEGDMEREVAQGKNIADAAAHVETLEHFIWSTLPSGSTVSGGKLQVPHMDGKAQVDEYIIESCPKLAHKTTFYWSGFYAENATYAPYCANFLQSAQKYAWIQPVEASTVVPMVGDHNVNTGLFVRRALEKPDLCLPRRYVLGVVDWMMHGDFLAAWATILADKEREDGKKNPVYVKSDLEPVCQLWPGVGNELGQMLRLSERYGKGAWTKEGVSAIDFRDLGLEVGDQDGDLVSTKEALERLALKVDTSHV